MLAMAFMCLLPGRPSLYMTSCDMHAWESRAYRLGNLKEVAANVAWWQWCRIAVLSPASAIPCESWIRSGEKHPCCMMSWWTTLG